jgi:transposase
MKIAFYESDVTDAQWEILRPMLPKPSKLGRPPTDRRTIINAIFYVLKGGIQWRLLPLDFPSWKTVYHIFRQWSRNQTWEMVNAQLRGEVRQSEGKDVNPTAAILDSQTVKSDPHGGKVGYNAAKHIKGRKRHVLVDTLGLLLGVCVTPASTPEREGGQSVLGDVLHWFNSLRLVWVDGGYTGEPFAQWVKSLNPKLNVEVVKRSDNVSGFKVLPRRWVVERTFAWLMQQRRLVRDYERSEGSAEAWISLAMIRLQLRRLA